jgi:PhoD-like phosphatase.
MSSPTYVAAQTPDTYGIVRYNVTGLTPNTRHYFRIADTPAGGTEALVGQIGTVRTLGAAGSVVLSRRVAIGGCLLTNTTETQALQAVNSWAPDWGHYNGDFFYNGNNETNEATWVGKYNSQIDNVGTHLKTLIASGIASYELVSDHDSTNADNADSNSPWAPYELAGWNKVVPHLAGSGDATSRDQQWDDGRVSYFMTDIRTVNRSPGLNTDDASKTMLGAAQKARLLNWLATNTAPFKVLITDSPWMGANDTVAKPDAWWSYDNERQQIISAVHAQSSHFEVWHGDSHVLGYATPAKNTWGGFPVLCAAPYYNDGGGRNLSTFSEYFNNGGTWASQYGRVTITDDGSKITRTFEGYDAFSSSVKLTYVTEVQAARAAYQIWDNGQLIPVEVLGVWNGTSITPVEVLGVWNGTSIDPVEGA